MPRDERQVLLLQFQQKTHLLLQRKVCLPPVPLALSPVRLVLMDTRCVRHPAIS